MFESLFSIPVALLVLSFLIFVHELAHFVAGKAVGIHAQVFSIGFGPAILKWGKGRTEYRVSLFPAGGYVRFPGEYEEGDERLSGEYHTAAVWKRTIVVAAGPLSNVALGVAVFAFLAWNGLPESGMPPLGEIVRSRQSLATYWDDPTEESPAAHAGLQPGDRVLRVDDRKVNSWDEFTQEIMIRPERTVTLRLVRNGREMDVNVTPRSVLRGKMTVGQIGVAPAQKIALVDGDYRQPVVAVDGVSFYGWNQLRPVRASQRPVNEMSSELRSTTGPSGTPMVLTVVGGQRRVVVEARTALASAVSSDAPAELGDLEPNDTLESVNDVRVYTLDDVRRALEANPTAPATFVFVRNGAKRLTVKVVPDLTISVTGVDAKTSPAFRKLRLEDHPTLVAVNGISVARYEQVRTLLEMAAQKGEPVTFTFERHGRTLFFRRTGVVDVTTPVAFTDGHVSIPGLALQSNLGASGGLLNLGNMVLGEQLLLKDAVTKRSLEVEAASPELVRYGLIGSVVKGTEKTAETVVQMLSLLKRLVTGEVSVRYISGPVGIVNITQKTIARGGWSWETLLSLFFLMAFISVNLAIVNLLPIPIADGGQLLFFALERARGKPIDVKWQATIQQVSVLVLIGLFALVTLKDLVYW
jgi:regulator of sigma E protease